MSGIRKRLFVTWLFCAPLFSALLFIGCGFVPGGGGGGGSVEMGHLDYGWIWCGTVGDPKIIASIEVYPGMLKKNKLHSAAVRVDGKWIDIATASKRSLKADFECEITTISDERSMESHGGANECWVSRSTLQPRFYFFGEDLRAVYVDRLEIKIDDQIVTDRAMLEKIVGLPLDDVAAAAQRKER